MLKNRIGRKDRLRRLESEMWRVREFVGGLGKGDRRRGQRIRWNGWSSLNEVANGEDVA